MTEVYPTSIHFYAQVDKENNYWVDLIQDINSPISADYGISGNKINNLVASSGQCSFSLKNDAGNQWGKEGAYSPDNVNSLQGWKRGIKIQVVIQYDDSGLNRNEDFYCVWGGYVYDITPSTGSNNQKIVKVKCLDWMNFAATHPIQSPEIIYEKEVSQVVEAIVAEMPMQPSQVDYHAGYITYPTCFDMVRTNTKALSEFQKVATSELANIFIRPPSRYELSDNPAATEILTVLGRTSRQANDTNYIPDLLSNSYYIVAEEGDYFTSESEDNPSFYWKTNEITPLNFINNMKSLDVEYGGTLVNSVTIKVYPRTVDNSAQVLATLDKPLKIENNTPTILSLDYKDPDNLAISIAGDNMVDPVATTDYLMNSLESGSGTNLTALLSVSASYVANRVDYLLLNISGSTAYITKLQARGLGIYAYNPPQYTAEDEGSINTYGYSSLTIDQKYLDDISLGEEEADTILLYNRYPCTSAKKLTCNANQDSTTFNMFLNTTVGKKVYVEDSDSGVADNFYIQRILFTINQGGTIDFSYELAPVYAFFFPQWILGYASKSELGSSAWLG